MILEVDKLSFEEALRELEDTVTRLESGELTLEGALALFERGQYLVSYCNGQLDRAALRVELLTEEGEIVEMKAESLDG